MLKKLTKPFFVLAPMDDVTETVFRQIVQSCAPADLYFTEFVNVDGLESAGREKLLPKLRFTDKEGPLIAQLWGKNPENFYKTTRQIADGSLAKELGLPDGVNFAGVDLNMGCPAKSEVQNGTCSALILPINRELAGQIIDASREGLTLKNGTSLPLSVKTRLGYGEIDYSWHEFLLNKKLNMLTIHARTKRQMSKVPAEWDKLVQIRELRDKLSPATLIVGNGDVLTHQQGEDLAKKYSLDGIMIGRGIFHDPFVFARQSPWPEMSSEERIKLLVRHIKLFDESWGSVRRYETLKKFAKVYINGFDGAKELREKIMATQTAEEALNIIQ